MPQSKYELTDSPLTADIEEMVERKNASYGNSIGKSSDLLRTLCPDGIPVTIFHRAHVLIRVLDKVSRLFSPNINYLQAMDAWNDIQGYCVKARQLEGEYFEDKHIG